MEINPADRISKLPEFILQDILSLLPRKDAARTCVLSKQWSLIWKSFPTLDFEQDILESFRLLFSHDWSGFTLYTHTFLSGAKNSLIKSSNSKLIGHRFRLVTWNCDLESSSKVIECFDLALRIGVPEIEIRLNTTAPITETQLGVVIPTTTLVPIPLKYHSLKTLSLRGICLTEEWIHCALENCPNISHLSLHHILGLQRLHISRNDKLVVVSIDSIPAIVSVDIVAPKLQEFHFKGKGKTYAIDLSSCRDLRKLRLESVEIKDDVFHCLISKFPLLEDLTLYYTRVLGTVLVSGTNLRRVDISFVDQKAIEIDGPATLSCRFEGKVLPRMFFKRVPSQLEIVFEDRFFRGANTLRFVHLREFLASFSQVQVLSVEVQKETVSFDHKELKGTVVPPLPQLDLLKLSYMWSDVPSSFDANPLIEGLLWSARPKRISVTLDSSFESKCIKILCAFLFKNKKDDQTCCGSSHIKCWRHHLKSLRIESVGGYLDSADFLDKFMCNEAFGEVIVFELEWDDSIY